MSIHMLTQPLSPHQRGADISVLPDLKLRTGRAHEVCGSARRSFALWVAGALTTPELTGPVLWLCASWEQMMLLPDGMCDYVNPSRFLFVHSPQKTDLLWVAEEALRAACVSLVVIDLPAPPALTPVRRLHLAAETGGDLTTPRQSRRQAPPTVLLLTPDTGGAQGVESRWHLIQDHPLSPPKPSQPPPGAAPDGRERWKLTRLRARQAPPKSWHVERTLTGELRHCSLKMAP